MSTILAAGWLRKKCHGARTQALKYTVGFLNEKHLPLVMTLQEVIIQHLQRPELLQPFSCDFMKQHMGNQGIVLGVFVEHRLAAFRNIYFPAPGDREWNLGRDLELPEDDLTKVANLQMVCVHPDYRGNGLALKMNQVSLGLLRERGGHRHICATVSPYNLWNLPVLLASGFRIVALKSKYGGKLRYIVYQDLQRPFLFDDKSAFQVRLDDFNTQKKWLDAGFCGVALDKRENKSGETFLSGIDLVLKQAISKKPLTLPRPWPTGGARSCQAMTWRHAAPALIPGIA